MLRARFRWFGIVALAVLASSACVPQGEGAERGAVPLVPPSISAPVLRLAGSADGGVEVNAGDDVSTRSVYPGIDLSTSLVGDVPSYTFVVSPSGDPRDIALTFPAASSVRIADHGALLIQTPDATFRQPKPYVYQTVGSHLIEIRSRYVRRPDGGIGVWLEQYAEDLTLVIDPELRRVATQ